MMETMTSRVTTSDAGAGGAEARRGRPEPGSPPPVDAPRGEPGALGHPEPEGLAAPRARDPGAPSRRRPRHRLHPRRARRSARRGGRRHRRRLAPRPLPPRRRDHRQGRAERQADRRAARQPRAGVPAPRRAAPGALAPGAELRLRADQPQPPRDRRAGHRSEVQAGAQLRAQHEVPRRRRVG